MKNKLPAKQGAELAVIWAI